MSATDFSLLPNQQQKNPLQKNQQQKNLHSIFVIADSIAKLF